MRLQLFGCTPHLQRRNHRSFLIGAYRKPHSPAPALSWKVKHRARGCCRQILTELKRLRAPGPALCSELPVKSRPWASTERRGRAALAPLCAAAPRPTVRLSSHWETPPGCLVPVGTDSKPWHRSRASVPPLPPKHSFWSPQNSGCEPRSRRGAGGTAQPQERGRDQAQRRGTRGEGGSLAPPLPPFS